MKNARFSSSRISFYLDGKYCEFSGSKTRMVGEADREPIDLQFASSSFRGTAEGEPVDGRISSTEITINTSYRFTDFE